MPAKTEPFERGKYTGAVTPYRFRRVDNKGCMEWRISYGLSGFLLAYGSQWSVPYGKRILRHLEDDYWKRQPKRNKLVPADIVPKPRKR